MSGGKKADFVAKRGYSEGYANQILTAFKLIQWVDVVASVRKSHLGKPLYHTARKALAEKRSKQEIPEHTLCCVL